jgi:hypothetical protein
VHAGFAASLTQTLGCLRFLLANPGDEQARGGVTSSADRLHTEATWQKVRSVKELANPRKRDHDRWPKKAPRRIQAHEEIQKYLAESAEAWADSIKECLPRIPNPAAMKRLEDIADLIKTGLTDLEGYLDAKSIQDLSYGKEWMGGKMVEVPEEFTPLQHLHGGKLFTQAPAEAGDARQLCCGEDGLTKLAQPLDLRKEKITINKRIVGATAETMTADEWLKANGEKWETNDG